jgi:hypothetical protein
MERIKCQVPGSQKLATQVLLWIRCAKRPLTTKELQHALAVEIDTSELEENIPEIEDIVSVCAGLVTIDNESDIIRLVHYTTQEFFERTQNRWFPDAETHITKICVTYLSYDVFGRGICATAKELKKRHQSKLLYDYAARNWGHHAHAASAEAKKLILESLRMTPRYPAAARR